MEPNPQLEVMIIPLFYDHGEDHLSLNYAYVHYVILKLIHNSNASIMVPKSK